MDDEEGFLAALAVDPADDTTRLIYADWLDERDEVTKAEFLRLTVGLVGSCAGGSPVEESRLLAVSRGLPLGWRAAAGCRFAVVLQSYPPWRREQVWVSYQEISGLSIEEAKARTADCPAVLLGCGTYLHALGYRQALQDPAEAEVVVRPSDPGIAATPPVTAVVQAWLASWREEGSPPEAIEAFQAFLSHNGATLDADKACEGYLKLQTLASGLEYPHALALAHELRRSVESDAILASIRGWCICVAAYHRPESRP